MDHACHFAIVERDLEIVASFERSGQVVAGECQNSASCRVDICFRIDVKARQSNCLCSDRRVDFDLACSLGHDREPIASGKHTLQFAIDLLFGFRNNNVAALKLSHLYLLWGGHEGAVDCESEDIPLEASDLRFTIIVDIIAGHASAKSRLVVHVDYNLRLVLDCEEVLTRDNWPNETISEVSHNLVTDANVVPLN